MSVAGLAALALPVGIAASRDAPGGAPAPQALPVAVAAVTSAQPWTRTREYTGRLEARRSSELGFERGGRLDAVLVAEGQRVTRGEVLARLDSRRLEARRRDLEARLAQARARLDEMRAGPGAETIAAARARLRAQGADVELLQLKRTRRERLLAKQVIAREELEEVRSALAAQEARRDAAERELDELLAGTRPERLRAQEALVAQLEANLAEVGIELEDSALRAPFGGTVSGVRTDQGTVLAAGQPVLGLVEDGALEARVGLPADRAAALEPGGVQRLRSEAGPFQARVRALLPQVDPTTRTVTCILEVVQTDDGAARPRPGQVVRLELPQEVAAGGFWLPLAALVKGERALWSCYAVVSGEGAARAERRRLEVLAVEADRALVRGDLRPGDRIVARGVHRVVPGQRVTPAPATP